MPMQGRNRTTQRRILPVGFAPRPGYGLDIEVIRASLLRGRAPAGHWDIPQRPDFHLLVCVDEGRFRHTVDFAPLGCRPGSVLLIHPGQVHVWDMRSPWDGWIVIVRPEALGASDVALDAGGPDRARRLGDLPCLLNLPGGEFAAVVESMRRMQADASAARHGAGLTLLLRAELQALVLRLAHHHRPQAGAGRQPAKALDRFGRFKAAVDRNFTRLHAVSDYATLLGCTQRTLQRAALACANRSAKAVVKQRLALEAKRLLVHSDAPIARIAEQLGFSEATNFVKFFRREAGRTPGEFRARQGLR